jgi:hypothetical protein
LVIKTLDPHWTRIRIGIQPEMPDPDPFQMYTDPKHCFMNTYIWFAAKVLSDALIDCLPCSKDLHLSPPYS